MKGAAETGPGEPREPVDRVSLNCLETCSFRSGGERRVSQNKMSLLVIDRLLKEITEAYNFATKNTLLCMGIKYGMSSVSEAECSKCFLKLKNCVKLQ